MKFLYGKKEERRACLLLKRKNIIRLAMRVSLIYVYIMMGCMQIFAYTGNGQNLDKIPVTVSVENESLRIVFETIEQQTDLSFNFYPDQINDFKVTIAKATRSVKETLDLALSGTSLIYLQVNNNVVIKRAANHQGNANNEMEVPSKGQESLVTIQGIVTDNATAQPLAGVNILVKGTAKGTTSDGTGRYIIDASEKDILIFSFIGFKPVEIAVGNRTEINISLETDVASLQEVVINAGYYNVIEEQKTGSISKVSSDVIQNQPINNPLLALQGRIPGVFIESSTGMQGSKMNVSIRGKNSIQNGTEPLYVIDGVPYPVQSLSGANSSGGLYGGQGISPFYSINPNDIESIEILKDADATAIYGSRGANGVILITTKKGKQGKTKFNLNVSTGASKVAYFLDLMNSEQYLKMRHLAFKNDNNVIESYHYDINGTWDTTRYTNWQRKLIGGSARTTTAQAIISGGQNNTQYLFSGSYQNQTTVFPDNSDSDKGSILFSITNESPNEKFKSRFASSFIINKSDMLSADLTSTSLLLAPVAPHLYTEDGQLNWENSTFENPLQSIKMSFGFKSYNLITNAMLSYEILKGLTIKSNFGINHLQREEQTSRPSSAYNPAYGLTPTNSQVYATTGSNRSWIAEPQIMWNNLNESVGNISLLFGGSFQSQETIIQQSRYENFATNALMNDPSSAAITDVERYSKPVYKYAAIFGRINYNFKEKYILNFTGRRDGSSRFGPGKQFANLGAVGAAWIFSNEDFVKSLSFLNFGKLRASYGLTGNDQINDYMFLDSYRSYVTYSGANGIIPSRLYNSDYAWETTKKVEAAIELRLFNNRLNWTAAYYNNRSSNQLVNYKLAGTSGFQTVLKNFPAKIENSGIELELSSINIERNIEWRTSFNISIPNNRLIKFPNIESSSYADTYVEGKSLSITKRYQYLGVDQTTGLYTFEDMNNDGSITAADRLAIIDLRTNFHGGLNNSLSFRGWTIDVFFQFVKKNAESSFSSFYTPGESFNQPASISDREWTSENPSAETFQRFSTNNSDATTAYERYLGSTEGIVDASFIRLKNVAISYTFPSKWTGGIESKLFIQGQNVFTLTKYKGLDPETGTSSVLPTLRTFVIGVNISL